MSEEHATTETKRRRRSYFSRRLAIARRKLPRILGIDRPGRVAGIELDELAQMASTPGPVGITCIDYCPDQCRVTEVDDIEAVRRGAPSRVVGRAVDQRRRAHRHEGRPRARRQIQPPPAGHRGPAARQPPPEGRTLRRRRTLPGQAVPDPADVRPPGWPPAWRADQHVPRAQHRADLRTDARRCLGQRPAAPQHPRVAPADQRREFPRLRPPRRHRRQLLPDPGTLRRPARGGGD